MRRRRGGASAIEFALGFPVLMVLLFGVMDWSWQLTHQLTAVSAAQRGARIAAGVDAEDGPEVIAKAEARAWLDAHAMDGGSATIDVTIAELAGSTGPVLTVTVSAPLEPLVGLLPMPGKVRGEASVAWYGEP
ncbi:MAG: pilus assembly protein [Alphaproteobacteria bacterium]|nr:pilus assembly protein [Alphaproteobacteria bacterium]